MTIQAKIGAILLCLLVGFGSGWVVHGWKVKAGLTDEMKGQIAQANRNADQRVQDEKTVRENTEAQLAGEQAKTRDLNNVLNTLRTDNASLQDRISHATFTRTEITVPSRVPGGAPTRCPSPAVGSPEFVRLYTAAAQGGASGATGAGADPGGVP